jgi:hypothetical protein
MYIAKNEQYFGMNPSILYVAIQATPGNPPINESPGVAGTRAVYHAHCTATRDVEIAPT